MIWDAIVVQAYYHLTHWGRVTHTCVSKLITIGSDNGLSPGWHLDIIWINAGILVLEPQVTNSWWRHQMETFSALLTICAGIHRSPVNSPHKGQWRGALMLSLICARINDWVNNLEAVDLIRHRGHYDVNVMWQWWNDDKPSLLSFNSLRPSDAYMCQ